MTDKEIIIDGVDVRECVEFRDDVYTDKQINNACSIGLWQRHYRGLKENCKMSCECKNNSDCYFKQLKRKEQECEKLKAIVTEAEEAPICFHCSEEPCIRQERDKYKQALDEIDNLISPCCPELYKTCLECDKYTCTFRKIKDILGIINKAKENTNE